MPSDEAKSRTARSPMNHAAMAWTRWFVTEEVRALGPTATTRATALVLATPIAMIATVLPALAQLFDGRPTPLTPTMAISVCSMFALGPLILRWTKSPNLAGAWALLGAVVATAIAAAQKQGIDSILMVWFLVIPMVAGFFLGARWTVVFSVICALCISGFWAVEWFPELAFDKSGAAEFAREDGHPFIWINLLTALAAISTLGLFWERAAHQAQGERDSLEAELRRRQKLETVGMLAGGIAHDFNNILAAILGHASLLETELDAHPSQRRVQAIVDSSRRAAILVEQMLAYAGRARTRSGTIDLPKLVREVVELLRPALAKRTELILELDASVPAIVGDPVQIQQIAMNLVTNASEALEGERGRVFVAITAVDANSERLDRAPRPGDYVMLEVRDEGCGIAPETLESIFDPFFTTKPSGHGLGLAAVLGIVRSHDGDIEVLSTVGEGTRFRVLLPCPDEVTRAAAESADEPRPRVRLPSSIASDATTPTRSSRRANPADGYVLIVDDEAMIRELAREVLEAAGHEVLLASDGDEGLEVFERWGPEIGLVVLDRTMPGLDGLELLGRMRRRRPELPAIISSGYASDDGNVQLSAHGIDAVLQKPWAPKDFVHVVQALGLEPRSPAARSSIR